MVIRMKFERFYKFIEPPNEKARQLAKEYNDNLIKPIGSLGRLEELAIQISGITGQVQNCLDKKAIIIMSADNGVYEEGVSTAPQEVTAVQTINMLNGKTGVAVLAKQGGIDLKVVDIGINRAVSHSSLICKKIALGTKNIAKGEAMTKEQFLTAVETGFSLVEQLKREGYKILGTGEMGISNTTTAESVIMALLGTTVDEIAGKGAGLTEELFLHKKEVLKKIKCVNQPNPKEPWDVVQKVGGFDIAGLLGCFLGAAYFKIPIIIDGVISIAAALVAYCCNPLAKEYMIPSHTSAEPAYVLAAKEMGLHPYFAMDMRLGEGSGCPFAFYVAEAATKIVQEMATFEEGNVERKNYIDIREE